MQFGPNTLPPELLLEISSYLKPKELISFSLVCRNTNEASRDNALWKPFLNRLTMLDPQSSINEGQTQYLSFKENFKRINQQQMLEIGHFQKLVAENRLRFNEEDELTLEAITSPTKQLHILEQRDDFLNKLNAFLIRPKIDITSKTLIIDDMNLTRLPELLFKEEAYQEYWKRLEMLYCSDNKLQTLPASLGNCQALQELNCWSNKLQALPESLGNCQALQTLACFDNKLQALPASLGNCQALQELHCSNNQLQALPESLGNCQMLQELHFPYNKLQALPESLGNCQALQTLDCWSNKLQALPESLGNCQALQKLYCFNNQITALPLALKTKFGAQWYTQTLKQQDTPVSLSTLNRFAPSSHPIKTSLVVGALGIGMTALTLSSPLTALAWGSMAALITFTGIINRKMFYQQSSKNHMPLHILPQVTRNLENNFAYLNGCHAARGWMPYLQSQISVNNWKNIKAYAAGYHDELTDNQVAKNSALSK